MPHPPGKFCIDRNTVRWSLLQGIITRKTLEDPPAGGQDLPVKQVTAIEKVWVKKTERSPWAWPATLVAVALLAVSWWSGVLLVRLLVGLAGLGCLYWGVERIRPRTALLEAYRIVAPGLNQEDWVVVGSTSEIIGFIDAMRAEMAQETGAVKS